MFWRSSFQSKVLLAFGTAMLVVLGMCAITWRLATDTAHAVRQADHTQDLLQALSQARSATLQAELSTQSYRMSGDEGDLTERDAATARREQLLQRIRQLVGDDSAQRARWTALRSVLDKRIALSRQIEDVRRRGGQAAADALVARAPLKETRAQTRRLLDEMEADESAKLDQRNADWERNAERMRRMGALATLLLTAQLAATGLLVRRQWREADRSRRELEDSEERLAITLRSIGEAVMATDNAGRITRMNPVAERLTGWSAPQAIGQQVEQVVHLVDEAGAVLASPPVSLVLADGQARCHDRGVALLARDGTSCPVAFSAMPKRDLQGRLRGTVIVLRDVTLERQAQRSIEAQNEWLAARVQERTAQLRNSEAHLRSVTSHVPALIAYVDAEQRYVYANRPYIERFAPARDDITGCQVAEVLGEARYAVAAPLISRALRGEPQTYDWEPFPGVWQVIHYVPQRDAEERVVGYYVLGTDITERKRAEARISGLNVELGQRVQDLERVSRALRTLSAGNRTLLRARDEAELLHGMCEAIVTTGGYGLGVIWYRVDDAARTLLPMAQCGYPGGLRALQRLHVSWADDDFGAGVAGETARTGVTTRIDDVSRHPGYAAWRSHPDLVGQLTALGCPLRVGGQLIGALTIYDPDPGAFDADEVDVLTESADDLAFGIATLRARAEQARTRTAMARMLYYDALTGLPNQTQFASALDDAVAAASEEAQPFAALQINIDRLREVNDALGFSHGDTMLRDFAARLQAAAPEDALVARLRGDEFAILVRGADRSAAATLARQLDERLAQPFDIAGIPLDVSFKTGIVLFPEHGTTTHDVFRHMDIALHQAKRRGAKHDFFDASSNRDQPSRLSLASDLKRAIDGGQLRLYLQPKVDMRGGQVCGAEALVRWQHPERGLVAPGEFIALAEHTGLIKQLTEWMLTQVLALNRDWAAAGQQLPIAVNLSARNLRDEDLPGRIRRLLAEHGTAPGLLELEITESTVMEDAELSLGLLHELRNLGIPLHIDDFGTGYSSLSYLQRLPVDCIKIDQSFVRDMSRSKESSTIVRSTIDLVHDLGRLTVAEGIETQADWDQLARLGCDIAQGYFIGRPMPAAEFQAWLRGFAPPAAHSG